MSQCSAEFSYEQCGGDDGFCGPGGETAGGGGGFGDYYALHYFPYAGMSEELRQSVRTYEERVNNAIHGNGFRTFEEIVAEMFRIHYDDYPEDNPQAANPRFYAGALTVYQFMPREWQVAHIIRDATAPIHDTVFPGYSRLTNWISRRLWGTDLINTESKTYQGSDTVVAVVGAITPGPGGKAKLLNVSVRGNKAYAKQLFRQFAGQGPMKVMRDRLTGRAIGLRNQNATVFYRPKFGKNGVTANVEIINNSVTRVNIHIRP